MAENKFQSLQYRRENKLLLYCLYPSLTWEKRLCDASIKLRSEKNTDHAKYWGSGILKTAFTEGQKSVRGDAKGNLIASNQKYSFKYRVHTKLSRSVIERFFRFGNKIDCTKKQNVANRHRIMLISVPYVLIWKPKSFFLVDRRVFKTTQKCSQTNPFPRYEAFFLILVENKQISKFLKYSFFSIQREKSFKFEASYSALFLEDAILANELPKLLG